MVQEAMQFTKQTKKKVFFIDIINKPKLLKSQMQKHMLQNERIEDFLVIFKNTPIADEDLPKNHDFGFCYSKTLHYYLILSTKLLPITKTMKS